MNLYQNTFGNTGQRDEQIKRRRKQVSMMLFRPHYPRFCVIPITPLFVLRPLLHLFLLSLSTLWRSRYISVLSLKSAWLTSCFLTMSFAARKIEHHIERGLLRHVRLPFRGKPRKMKLFHTVMEIRVWDLDTGRKTLFLLLLTVGFVFLVLLLEAVPGEACVSWPWWLTCHPSQL